MPYPPTAGGPQSLVDSAVAHATKIPAPRIAAHVRSLRRRNPNASPERIIEILGSELHTILASTGGAVGATAAVPGVGSGTALALTAADLAAFLVPLVFIVLLLLRSTGSTFTMRTAGRLLFLRRSLVRLVRRRWWGCLVGR